MPILVKYQQKASRKPHPHSLRLFIRLCICGRRDCHTHIFRLFPDPKSCIQQCGPDSEIADPPNMLIRAALSKNSTLRSPCPESIPEDQNPESIPESEIP
ncbi:unnamed protein product [Leuciscus chuanchicus]